jgi:hypothetical protein
MAYRLNGFPRGFAAHSSIGMTAAAQVRVRESSGATLRISLENASRALSKGSAKIVDAKGNIVPEQALVLCRRSEHTLTPQSRRHRLGIAVKAIDPGGEHQFYIVPSAPLDDLTVCKSACKPVGKCADADEHCGSCVNRKPN